MAVGRLLGDDGRMGTLRAVSADFLEAAPYRFVKSAVVRRPPQQVFDALADPAAWGDWFPGFDHSGHWATKPPPGTGSRRIVRVGRITFEETIIAWEAPSRFAFRVDRAGIPVARALAEDYRVEPHAEGSRLEWTFAIDPPSVLRPLVGLYRPIMQRTFEKAAGNLDAHLGA